MQHTRQRRVHVKVQLRRISEVNTSQELFKAEVALEAKWIDEALDGSACVGGVVWCSVVWCDVAWCGMVWRGVVWHGVG